MCGIFGYRGPKGQDIDCETLILEGLKALEYRGYDSWGIALNPEGGMAITSRKEVGKISLAKAMSKKNIRLGIGHTRWATHGKVSKDNSHPHHDTSKRFYVVHNGIIENYDELRKKLDLKGFYSETDSEIIPKLIAKNIQNNNKKLEDSCSFEESVRKTAKMLKGNYAFVAIDRKNDKMVAARNGSPLVVGQKSTKKGKHYFVASDIPSFLPHTKEVFFLEDGEMTVIGDDISFSKISDGKPIRKKVEKINWSIDRAMKGKYKHFMLKEIHEQDEVVKETAEGYYKEGRFRFDEYFSKKAIVGIKDIKKIIIIACGTSWHAGLVSEYWFEAFSDIPVEVEYASEFRYRKPVIKKGTVVIAISQSGETADTIAAIKEAKSKKSRVISICNVIGSTIDRISDISLYTRAGPEIGVASTKAFTTQMTVLLLMSLFFASRKKTIPAKEIQKKLEEMEKIPGYIINILDKEEHIKKVAKKYYKKKNALFLGRGVNFPIALEGALKLKEISYIHAEGYPAAEMKHGPIALIDKDMPSIFVCVKDESYEKVISNIQEIKARKGKVIAIATENDKEIGKLVDDIIFVPLVLGSMTPFLTAIPMQMLAYHIADIKKREIDKPRNLAKSVTVE
jgi:glucosamine--fructose-6-phosphate aminotransferase (isomerizing)